MHGKGELPLTLMFLLMMEGTSVTGEDLEPAQQIFLLRGGAPS